LTQFSESQLVEDYHFLEEVNSASIDAKKGKPKDFKAFVPNHLKSLFKECQDRKIDLRIMPPVMSKRKNNSTIFDKSMKKIFWRVQWVFSSNNIRLIDARLDESQTLFEALRKHLEDLTADHQMQQYVSHGPENLVLYLKVEPSPANQLKYFLLDSKHTLQQTLMYKTIIEFPTIIVALPNETDQYPLFIAEQDCK